MTKKILVTGIVQGVGFRPCCKKLADEMGLCGTVKNLGGNVEIIIHANDRVTKDFLRRLVSLLPKDAYISDTLISDCEEYTKNTFEIIPSACSTELLPDVIPDIATCDECLRELKDPANRRYLHPFISCAACGPRYSIIKSLPYDRENTLMDKFPLCEKCETEYKSPSDRRLYAQTVACKSCGPTLCFSPDMGSDPISSAVKLINNEGVIAVKDIGGFHFVCSPNSRNAVIRLRRLKCRDKKPFAVMFPSLQSVKQYAEVNSEEEKLLTSSARPIVLLKKIDNFCEEVCTDSRFIGAMLPSNPIQTLLSEKLGPLIMTSGNISGEPIITENEPMLDLLLNNEFLDGVLYHDREIIAPLDDSIYYVIDNIPHIMRRGRGVAPCGINLKGGTSTVFASGGDLKSCFGFYKNGKAVLSQHFGDLENDGCSAAFERSATHMAKLFDFNPDITACDMHPTYFVKDLPQKLFGKESLMIQHHHAHIASVMAEHNLTKVCGIALDGTGYGTDGGIWGGEILLCEGTSFTRFASFKPITMCGGDELAKNAREALCCYLLSAQRNIPEAFCDKNEAAIINAAVTHNINCISYSGCGRLFDAVCCVLGLGQRNEYEGQCAIKLENAASLALEQRILAYPLKLKYNNDVFNVDELVSDILNAVLSGADRKALALGFHYALAEGLISAVTAQPIKDVALSGGTFNNRILTSYICRRLREEGFNAYLNEQVPCGDGGIALGQLYLASKKE